MEGLQQVVLHLKKLSADFYGQVVLRIRQGKIVLIEENRTIKLEKDHQSQLKR